MAPRLAILPAGREDPRGHRMGYPDPHTTIPTHSVWEIVGQADGGLSVLRTFRLLRVLKLVRFLPALRRQLVVLMRTMDNVATFCMLLMLFIFIFRWVGPKLLPQAALTLMLRPQV